MESPSGSQAVDRAAELLVRIVEAEAPASVGDLAEAAGLPKSTTSRLLRALETRGLVQRDGPRGSLRPGPVLVAFARTSGSGVDLVAATATALDELAALTGETVNLAIAGHDGVEHLAQRDSRYFLGSSNWIGRPVPFHAAANGKVFLAFGVARLPRGPLAKLTAHTISDRGTLDAELADVRTRGWATAVEELEPGLLAVAAPVRGPDGEVVAALSVSAPSVRLTPETLEALGPQIAVAAGRVST
jgi:DNA-binding IclR family transcriptional regulator